MTGNLYYEGSIPNPGIGTAPPRTYQRAVQHLVGEKTEEGVGWGSRSIPSLKRWINSGLHAINN